MPEQVGNVDRTSKGSDQCAPQFGTLPPRFR